MWIIPSVSSKYVAVTEKFPMLPEKQTALIDMSNCAEVDGNKASPIGGALLCLELYRSLGKKIVS